MTSCLAARQCQTGRQHQQSTLQPHASSLTARPQSLTALQTPAQWLLTLQHPRAALPPPLQRLQRQQKLQRLQEGARCRRAAPQRRPPTPWFRCDSNANAVPPYVHVMSITVAINSCSKPKPNSLCTITHPVQAAEVRCAAAATAAAAAAEAQRRLQAQADAAKQVRLPKLTSSMSTACV